MTPPLHSPYYYSSGYDKRWAPNLPLPARRERRSTTTWAQIFLRSRPSGIYKLHGDVLFEIFTFYGANVFSEPGGHRDWWRTLALVCSKWNDVIYSWPSHFLAELRFGNTNSTLFRNISHQRGNSVAHSLKCSPHLPLNLHYDLIHTSVQNSKGDEDDIVVLLRHLERVYSLQLRLSLSIWHSVAAAASTPVSCTCLEHVYLDTGDRATGFVLPDMFLEGYSPRLRTLMMIGVFSPSLSSLLHSPTLLTCLVLDGIPDSSHLPSGELLVYLSNMPQLQSLNIGFLSATRCRLAGGVNLASSLGHVALRHLKKFHFRGVSTYLESILINLNAAAVYELVFTLFHQLQYTIPHISAFLRRTKQFGFNETRINFWPDSLVISATPALSHSPEDVLCLRIPCPRLDFQVASAAQICRALGPNLADTKALLVKCHQDQLPTQGHGDDPALWKELLSQFHGLKMLWISSALVSEVIASMGCDALQLLEEFPVLARIFVEIYEDETSTTPVRSLSELLASIRSLGGPVIDVYPLRSDRWST